MKRLGIWGCLGLLGLACSQPPDPTSDLDNREPFDPDKIYAAHETAATATVYYQPPQDPAPPAPGGCSCMNFDLYGCGFQLVGYRLKDYMDPGSTPWDTVLSALYLLDPIVITTLAPENYWQDARRDIINGYRMCIGNNGADPDFVCPPECGLINEVYAATFFDPGVALINMVGIEDTEDCTGTYERLDLMLEPLNSQALYIGVVTPGDEIWYTEDVDNFAPALYDRYGYRNGKYCPTAIFDFTWKGQFDSKPDDNYAMMADPFWVIESGDDRYTFFASSPMDDNLDSAALIYEVDIDAKHYANLGDDYSKYDGINSYLPALNEPLRSAGDVTYHLVRSVGFTGPDAPVIAMLSLYTEAGFRGRNPPARGGRFLPTPLTAYQHPDDPLGTTRTTIDTGDRHYYLRLYPDYGSLSWDTGCYRMEISTGTFPLMLGCSGTDINAYPLQASGFPAHQLTATADTPGVPDSPYTFSGQTDAVLSSVQDIDWYDIVFKK